MGRVVFHSAWIGNETVRRERDVARVMRPPHRSDPISRQHRPRARTQVAERVVVEARAIPAGAVRAPARNQERHLQSPRDRPSQVVTCDEVRSSSDPFRISFRLPRNASSRTSRATPWSVLQGVFLALRGEVVRCFLREETFPQGGPQ
jgi:hypothetical protein